MKTLLTYRLRSCAVAAMLVFFAGQVRAQSVITVGAGSYASYPPTYENDGFFNNFAQNADIRVAPGETRPIPTNDWWTNIIYDENDPLGGRLWAMPLVVDPAVEGINIYNPWKWNAAGNDLMIDYPVVLKGSGFTPVRSIATNWSDWTVEVKTYQDINNKYVLFTAAHGIPFVWFNCVGFTPQIECYHGATYMNASGANITFPFTGEYFVIKYWDTYYGVHLPPGSTVTQGGTTGNLLTLNLPAGINYVIVSALPNAAAAATMHSYAYVKPTNTTVSWSYNPAQGTLATTWNLSTTNLRGAAQNTVMQGFLPHHYRTALSSNVSYNGITFSQSRGLLKMATGNSFTFTYRMNGILPNYPAPVVQSGVPNTYDPAKMSTIITNYANTVRSQPTPYGAADTYWGGKDLVRLAKMMLFAKETGHSEYNFLLTTLKNSLSNWLTFTPGEQERYFAWYPKWKGLIGFNESYYSGMFTDNHFHYGYFIQAAALCAMADPDFISQYSGILTMIAKQYANWDRNDANFPFLRTFDPWMGHSYAGGLSSPSGNNQESSSEAMQSWHALYFLGSILGNTAMRDVGAFGYFYEARATLEYWFDVNRDVWPSAYRNAHQVVGIMWPGGYVYGTYFGIDPQWIAGIQMLPISPAFHYFNQGFTPAQAVTFYNNLKNEMQAFYVANGNTALSDGGETTEAEIGDWGHVLLGWRALFDPTYVTQKMDAYWNSSNTEESNFMRQNVEAGQTYYYAHALQNLGLYQTDYYMTIPTSAAFYNATTGVTTYVVYNPSATAQTCTVYRNGTQVASFSVPARTLYKYVSGGTNNNASNLALNKPTVVSSIESAAYPGSAAVDGNPATRWSSAFSDPQWIYVDLGATYNISQVKITWETAYGRDYQIQVSSNATTWTTIKTVTGNTALVNDHTGLNATGRYVRIYGTARGTQWGYSIFELEVYGAPASAPANVALNKPTTVSSTESAAYPGSAAVDGNPATRWSSAFSDPQWIYVDLGATYNISQVKITWETAYGRDYQIQVSSNATTWTTIKTVTGNTALVNDHTGLNATGRYVRIYGTARGTQWGYSIFELEVYGTLSSQSYTAVENIAANESKISIYPVPFSDRITLEAPEAISSIVVYDLSGRVCLKATPGSVQAILNTTSLRPGIYIVKVWLDNRVESYRVIKK
ncbi:MAG TPA: discoidin domain-containing protein [Bacteroidales bacterium]|nr:discoidin domain-containing protein [Bacteroidales bacterium]HPO65673.1 discoidin domain-containing protein [Bacteroidales bacterium]